MCSKYESNDHYFMPNEHGRDSPNLKTRAGKLCSGGIGAFTVTHFEISPWPLTKKSNAVATMTGYFNSPQTVSGLYLDALVNGKLPFKDTVPKAGTYHAGQTATFVQKAYVPWISPSGTYVVKVGLVNNQDTELNCWEIEFKF